MNPESFQRGRVLVLGRSAPVLEAVTGELAALGLTVAGSVRPDAAATAFEARDFDLLAIGGGVDGPTRTALKRAFGDRHPAILALDVHAPLAVQQILAAARGGDGAPRVDLDAYCARIAYDGPRSPDLATLRGLHERHPDAVAFEAVDVLLGRGVDLAPAAIDAKLIGRRRGGYCFEQNSLFRRVLETIGFAVTGLSARVRWNAPAGTPPRSRTHMVLRVDLEGEAWLADVGFGTCALTTPLRMDTTEPQATAHDTYRLIPFGTDLLLQVRRDDVWLPVYQITRESQLDADYEAANWFTSTHPQSPFRNGLMVARTAPESRYALLDGRFAERRPDGRTERRVLDADALERTLVEVFGLPVEADWRPVIERAALASRA